MSVAYRQLGPGDVDLLRAAATRFKGAAAGDDHARAWLASDHNLAIVAIEGRTPLGWVYGYALPRTERDETMFLLYEIDVAESHRRKGIGAELMRRFRGLATGPVWLLTNESNGAAMALYRSSGAERPNDDDVMLRFKSG